MSSTMETPEFRALQWANSLGKAIGSAADERARQLAVEKLGNDVLEGVEYASFCAELLLAHKPDDCHQSSFWSRLNEVATFTEKPLNVPDQRRLRAKLRLIEKWGLERFTYYDWDHFGHNTLIKLSEVAQRCPDWEVFVDGCNIVMLQRHIKALSQSDAITNKIGQFLKPTKRPDDKFSPELKDLNLLMERIEKASIETSKKHTLRNTRLQPLATEDELQEIQSWIMMDATLSLTNIPMPGSSSSFQERAVKLHGLLGKDDHGLLVPRQKESIQSKSKRHRSATGEAVTLPSSKKRCTTKTASSGSERPISPLYNDDITQPCSNSFKETIAQGTSPSPCSSSETSEVLTGQSSVDTSSNSKETVATSAAPATSLDCPADAAIVETSEATAESVNISIKTPLANRRTISGKAPKLRPAAAVPLATESRSDHDPSPLEQSDSRSDYESSQDLQPHENSSGDARRMSGEASYVPRSLMDIAGSSTTAPSPLFVSSATGSHLDCEHCTEPSAELDEETNARNSHRCPAVGVDDEVEPQRGEDLFCCKICNGVCLAGSIPASFTDLSFRQDLLQRCHAVQDLISDLDASTPVKQIMKEWTFPVRMASIYYEPTSLGNSTCTMTSADVLCFDEQTFVKYAMNDTAFTKPVIIKEEFKDCEDFGPQQYGNFLCDRLGKRTMSFRCTRTNKFVELSANDVKQSLSTPDSKSDGLNALDIASWAGAERPYFTRLPRFRLLEMLIQRQNPVGKNGNSKSGDVHDCLSFDLLGFTGAFSGPHIDTLTGTWLRILFGSKLWMFISPAAMTDRDWIDFARLGDKWRSNKCRAVFLERNDVFLMPPGKRLIHSVLTLQPCLVEGGMLWDETNILETIKAVLWVGENQMTTNEPFPFQLHTIVDDLLRLAMEAPGRFCRDMPPAVFLQEIKVLRKGFDALKCRCSKSCSEGCTCLQARRRCTPACRDHPVLEDGNHDCEVACGERLDCPKRKVRDCMNDDLVP